MKYFCYLVSVFYFLCVHVYADNNLHKTDVILLKDGSLIRAQIVEEKPNSIIVAYENSWKEISRKQIIKIQKSEILSNNDNRTLRVLTGFCNNYIIGYDYHDKAGYGFGSGFRIGYGINIKPRFLIESAYTITVHNSDTTSSKTIYLNALDINLKYILLSINHFNLYANIGMGLDLFSTEGADIGSFSYIPQIGIGSYIYLNEWADLDIGFNLHPVRFETNDDHKPDATYLQFLLLVNFKL